MVATSAVEPGGHAKPGAADVQGRHVAIDVAFSDALKVPLGQGVTVALPGGQ